MKQGKIVVNFKQQNNSLLGLRLYKGSLPMYTQIGKDETIAYASRAASIPQSTLAIVLEAMLDAFDYFLCNGHNIKFDGVGTFSLSLKARNASLFDANAKTGANAITALGINFLPDVNLKNLLTNIELVRNVEVSEEGDMTDFVPVTIASGSDRFTLRGTGITTPCFNINPGDKIKVSGFNLPNTFVVTFDGVTNGQEHQEQITMTSDGAAQISAEGKATTNFDEVHYVTIGGVQYPINLPSAIITRVYNLTERREYKGLTNGVLHRQGQGVQIRVEGKNLDKYNPVLKANGSEVLTLDVINKDYVIAQTYNSTTKLEVSLLGETYTSVRHSDDKTLPTVSSVGMNGRGLSSVFTTILVEDPNDDYNVDLVVVGENLKNASFASMSEMGDTTPIVPKRIATDGKSAIVPIKYDGNQYFRITGTDIDLAYVFYRVHSQMPIADNKINGIADGGIGILPAAIEGSVKIPVVCDKKLAEDTIIRLFIPGATEGKIIEFVDGVGYVTLTAAEAKQGQYTVGIKNGAFTFCSVELMAADGTGTRSTTKHTLDLSSNNNNWGTVTGAGQYNEGASATIKAEPKPGYLFDQWSDGNQNAERSVTVNRDMTLVATFYQEGTQRPSQSQPDGPAGE